MSKKIKLAKTAGFCHGVKRAVDGTKNLKQDNLNNNIYVLGELIHNSHVICELDNLGIKTVDNVPQNSCGYCVIRSHGASPKTFEQIKQNGLEIIDLTCPDVKKVQKKAIELASNDYLTLIVGKADHPEVIAIKDNALQYSENVFVVSSVEEVQQIQEKIKEHKKVGVVVQTTQMIENLNKVLLAITPLAKEIKVFNTICTSTSMRQKEEKELAHESDLMIVVGGKNSANTTHLAEIVKDITKTIHIENAENLMNYEDLIKSSNNIGITAGASTPDNLIQEVIKQIEQI